jgi:paraquat-inducible protein A
LTKPSQPGAVPNGPASNNPVPNGPSPNSPVLSGPLPDTAVPAPGKLIACHECDLLQREIPLPPGGVAACPRCGAVLYRNNPGGLERSLALLLASAVLFLVANAFPIVSIESQGNRNATTLLGAVLTLWNEDMPLVAGLVLFTTILAPAFELFTLILILAAIRLGLRLPALPGVLRSVLAARPWSMVEVFMLGVLVSVVKLAHLAHIAPGIALWSYAALILLFAAAMANFNARELWDRLSFEP